MNLDKVGLKVCRICFFLCHLSECYDLRMHVMCHFLWFVCRFHVDYFATVSLEVDRQISKYLHNVALERLNQYQARYRGFPQNITESSKAGLILYMGVKRVAHILKSNLNGGWVLTHSERRPQNIYSQEEMNLYCIIKLATDISLFSLQISKTWCFV